ncbi:MAG TPA: AAA family ATPase [Verrucomicrobiae bacterium]|jgi:hypothetical protein
MEPAQEYEARLAWWRQAAEEGERAHRRAGNWRLLLAAALITMAALLRNIVPVGFLLAAIFAGIFLTGFFHDRVLRRRDTARRLVAFYVRGLDRLGHHWMGKGTQGAEFLAKEHPYAVDLDIFGAGSLFELLNTAQTQAGSTRLAQWLLTGAERGEIVARQGAVDAMRSNVDLREDLAVRAGDPREHIHTGALMSWAARPARLTGGFARAAGFCFPLLTWLSLAFRDFPLFAAALIAQCGFAYFYQRKNKALVSGMLPSGELRWLADVLMRLERENFEAPRLLELQAKWKRDEIAASASLRQLAGRVEWMDSCNNELLQMLGPAVLLKTQFSFSVAAWHSRHGARIGEWLEALGEMEALSSLAGYACEHPEDVFPKLGDSASPIIDAQGLAHPLLAVAVRNDIALDASRPLHVISGSNMSGKSTWMRAIGVNIVLAMAGAPVRARACQMTALRIGASMRTVDSLQEGVSRFYAEIKRLKQIVQMAVPGERVVFLIDEVFGGTNSHDRLIGAAFVVKLLVSRGAVGLITTHDLALTRVVDEVRPHGENFHFEDQLAEGKLSFDYRLREGVVQKSNALDLMRSIGLDV